MRRIIFTLLITVFLIPTFAQRKCGSHEYYLQQLASDPLFAQKQRAIENFTSAYVAGGGSRIVDQQRGTVVYNIPVVVHVVYNTAAQNISDAQIQSQIDVLNKDFQLLNSDSSLVPPGFKSLVADCKIQFCLAKRDPLGNATTGIVRKQTSVTSFTDNDNVKKSSAGGDNAWDATKYLNLWICKLSGGTLGYAQFPGGAVATDGVVINYTAFGTTGSATAPFNLGRTATHEVGHWLNLRHIWGDDGTGCNGSDLVGDTPNQGDENYNCPTFPTISCSNGPNGDMFMNYMDYVDDRCMMMFTLGQRDRIYAVLKAGGARASLASSQGCVPPNTAGCGVPGTLAATNISPTGATLNWSAVPGAVSYILQYKNSSATSFTTVAAITAASYNLSGLLASTSYDFKVRAVCSSDTSLYSGLQNFVTPGTSSGCGLPTAVTAGTITQTGATISWTPVAGAISYTLKYKLSSASTFTTIKTSNNARVLTGLIPGVKYSYKVRTNCTDTFSAYSTVKTFTTLPDGCTDVYEANNTLATAASIPVNTTISAKIGTSTDKDCFKFTNSAAQPNIKLTLTNLPKDYDLKLFSPSGVFLKGSSGAGTVSETINYNTANIGTYVAYVLGYSGAFDTVQCYKLTAATSNIAFRESAEMVQTKATSVQVFPVPSSKEVFISLKEQTAGVAHVTITNQLGVIVMNSQLMMNEGSNVSKMDIHALPNGLYFMKISKGKFTEVKKLVISR